MENNKAPARGRVFALTGADLEPTEDLIQGTCFMNGIPLVVLYDSGATHSFIAETVAFGHAILIS
ncbi:hypothetical protein [Bacillus cereus]|uniref:hypothetical protein n=1 Tax=Bacillus cereus TaxID=1396 RepID=UPI0034D5D69A